MQQTLKVVSILLFIPIVLISCGPATPMPLSTETAMERRTSLPTNTSSPSPTATATKSQAEIIFTIPTHQTGDYPNTPTPIATPNKDASTMRLKNLTEGDLLHLIENMNQYSIQNFPSYQDWWSDGQFVDSQEPLALAIQEYLYRFPDSVNADRLRWQLAFINSILYGDGLAGNAYGPNWMLTELEKKLNQGEVPPDELETFLDRSWFEVADLLPIKNLFGDGKVAWLYVISPQVWQEEEEYINNMDFFDRGGLFAVVQELDNHKYKVHLLANDWSFINGSDSIFEISDHNRNGIPEIALNLLRHGGTVCTGFLKIFEWKGNSFSDLTKSKIKVGDCSDNYEYSFENGLPSIKIRTSMGGGTSIYTWNGNIYEFSGYQVTDPIEKWSFAQSPSEEAQALEAILISSDKEGLKSSQIDFLRYRLGIAYALNSEPTQIKRVLQDLADNPLDKTRTIYSDLAKNFLRYYSDDKTLYLACKKSREALYKVWGSLSGGEEDELFGYPSDFTFARGRLRCFDHDVLDVLVKNFTGQLDNIPDELTNQGMKFPYAKKYDINLDGLDEEWLIIIDDGIYMIHPDETGYRVSLLEYFWGTDPSQYSNIKINIEKWKDITNPVLTAVTPDKLMMYEIGKDFSSLSLSYDFSMDNVFFYPQRNPSQFQVFHKKPKPDEDFYGEPWSGYRWEAQNHAFKEDLLEYTLFVEHDPDQAIELVKTLLPVLNKWKSLDTVRYWLPRYFYLCGLTYELTSDEQRAAEIYWQLWHDFPESHYARLAEFKLELINP